jgi:hypothetical protein
MMFVRELQDCSGGCIVQAMSPRGEQNECVVDTPIRILDWNKPTYSYQTQDCKLGWDVDTTRRTQTTEAE